MLGLGVLQGQPLTTGYSLRLCVGGESSLKTFFFHVCVWNLQEYEVCGACSMRTCSGGVNTYALTTLSVRCNRQCVAFRPHAKLALVFVRLCRVLMRLYELNYFSMVSGRSVARGTVHLCRILENAVAVSAHGQCTIARPKMCV